MSDQIATALDAVTTRIERAATKARKSVSEITLVAVSKTKPVELMLAYERAARAKGIPVIFGENYLQELKAKRGHLDRWSEVHMIGPLQSNKVRDAVRYAEVIQSVHSLKILELIHTEAKKAGKTQRIFLQANVSSDESKSGFSLEELPAAVEAALAYGDSVRLEGFMTVTAFYDNPEDARPDFEKLNLTRHNLSERFGRPFTLSMGMSADFDIAIECGSEVVRVGSALFGDRESIA